MPSLLRTNTTVLLVCEGYAEVEFAIVIRDLYLPRGCGVALTARNRRGSSGAAALQTALEEKKRSVFDHYGVLVDTDQQWTDAERKLASDNEVVAIECCPSLEALLLSVDSRRVHARTADNKTAFRQAYGGDAHRPGVIRRNFDRAKLDGARGRLQAIDRFLSLIEC